ncbi:MAG: hypothetical protein AAF638_05630 [Pseudomonadota bacterium]
MAETTLPFGTKAAGARPNWQGATDLSMRLRGCVGLCEVQAWPSALKDAGKILARLRLADAALFSQPNRSGSMAGSVAMNIGPGRLLIEGSDSKMVEMVQNAVPLKTGTVVDQSHGRVAITLDGTPTVTTLAKAFNLDFATMENGTVSATGHHGVPVVLRRVSSQRFDLYVPRTFARDVFEALADQAADCGVRVRTETGHGHA